MRKAVSIALSFLSSLLAPAIVRSQVQPSGTLGLGGGCDRATIVRDVASNVLVGTGHCLTDSDGVVGDPCSSGLEGLCPPGFEGCWGASQITGREGGFAISDDGRCVVGVVAPNFESSPFLITDGPHAFVSFDNCEGVDLHQAFGLTDAVMEGITPDGSVAFGASAQFPSGRFVLSRGGTPQDLLAFSGLAGVQDFWVSRAGVVVFSTSYSPDPYQMQRWQIGQAPEFLGVMPRSFVPTRWSKEGRAAIGASGVWFPRLGVVPSPLAFVPTDVSGLREMVIGEDRRRPTLTNHYYGSIWRPGQDIRFFADVLADARYLAGERCSSLYSPIFSLVALDSMSEDGRRVGGRYFGEFYIGFVAAVDLGTRCRCDIDQNGVLTPDDLADYITAYFEEPNSVVADFDGNCQVGPDDLSDYVTAYFDGCG